MMLGDFINTIDNLGYGALIAILLDTALIICIGAVNGKKQFSLWSYIIALLLLIPLTFQMSRLVGACNISPASSVINDIITSTAPVLKKYVCSATREDVGWFIFRRILWTTLFIAAAACLIAATMQPFASNGRRHSSARYERTSSRRGSEHKPFRTRRK